MSTQFQKGNPGKPKGAKNKVNNEIREKFEQLLNTISVEQMADDLLALKPAERLKVVIDLAEYITPKLARTQAKEDSHDTIEGFEITIRRNREDEGLSKAG